MKNAAKRDVSGGHNYRRSLRLPRAKAVAYYPVNKIAASHGDEKALKRIISTLLFIPGPV